MYQDMLFVKFLPDILKELVKHVPALMFELLDWSDLGKEIPKMTGRLIRKEGFEEFCQKQSDFLSNFGIKISGQNFPTMKTAIPSPKLGEEILKLYFAQLFSPHGVALDLRIHQFESSDSKLIFHPSSLWATFDHEFRNGLIQMYQGFYLQDDSLLELGLMQTGLLKPYWSPETRNELKSLLKSHFGNSLEEGMIFSMNHFNTSFPKIARFLITNKVKISHNFLFLGIYLVSLYLALENIRSPLPVSKIFKEINNLSSKLQ